MKISVGYDYVLLRAAENPYIRKTTASGIFIPDKGMAFSQETGDIETLDKMIGFGIVTNAGPECKYLSEGDGVFYDTRSVRPIPNIDVRRHTNERNILSYVKKDELHEAFEDYRKDEEAFQARMEELRKQREAERSERLNAIAKDREQKEANFEFFLFENGKLIVTYWKAEEYKIVAEKLAKAAIKRPLEANVR